jgi:hypothetical protein
MPPYLPLNLVHNRRVYPTPNPNPSAYQKQYAQMFSEIDNYLLSFGHNTRNVAYRLLAPINEAYARGVEKSSLLPTYTSVKGSCSTLWGIILDLAAQIPHKHCYQDLLVDLLQEIKSFSGVLDKWTGQSGTINGSRLWDQLPMLGPEMHHAWCIGPYEGQGNGEPYGSKYHWTRGEFANLNAFAARLNARGVRDMDREAIRMFRATLETPASARVINDLLPSAVVYIRYAGRQIYCSKRWKLAEGDRGMSVFWAGELYQGLEGFCKRRWSFWKDRLGKVSQRGDLEECTRDLAKEAVELMKDIEEEDDNVQPVERGKGESGARREIDLESEGCEMDISEAETE